MKNRQSLQSIRVQKELDYQKTFKVGRFYTTVYPSDLVVKFVNGEGPRAVCFTGIVYRGGTEDVPIGTKHDGWVYESFKEYRKSDLKKK